VVRLAGATPQGENLEFEALLHSTENVKPGYVDGYPGSSQPLANCAPAFTSPTRSWVMGSPGYGSGAGRFVATRWSRFRCARTIRTTWKR